MKKMTHKTSFGFTVVQNKKDSTLHDAVNTHAITSFEEVLAEWIR